MHIEQSGEPVGEVVSFELVKKHCRVDPDYEDDLILQALEAAIEWVQDTCSTVFLKTEFTATGQDFCLSFKGYPYPEVHSITYVDRLGVPGEITDWSISGGRLVIDHAPEVEAATVVFTAGFGAGNVPKKLIRAIMMLAAYWNGQRESGSKEPMADVPMGVSAMIAHHRSPVF